MPISERESEDGAASDGDDTHATADIVADLPSPGDIVGERYEVVRSLGEGGMGRVFLAIHRTLNKEVALKVLDPQMAQSEEQASRFLREARAAAQLKHRNIVETTDFGSTAQGLPFFAMEYLDGEDLAQCLARRRKLPWDEAQALLGDILDGLEAAHAAGVVHRDLKPENCFLIKGQDEGRPRVKLVDFGIAKLLTEPEAGRLTNDGRILGTPQYMSPEQAIGRQVDARSDLYACGVLLFEMLTGTLPFSKGSTMAILSRQITQAPPKLRERIDTLPHLEGFEAIVARALEKKADDRYPSAAAFATDLRGVAGLKAATAPTTRRWWAAGLTVAAVAAAAWSLRESPEPERRVPEQAEVTASRPVATTAVATTKDSQRPGERTRPAAVSTPSPTAPPPAVPTSPEPLVEAAPTPSPRPSDAKPRAQAREQPAKPTAGTAKANGQVRRQLERSAQHCRRFAGPGGQRVKVRVTVSANGETSGASVRPPYDGHHPLGQCVAEALNGVTLPDSGGAREITESITISAARKPTTDSP